MKARSLSVTWRVRLLNGLLSAVVLIVLVVAAQVRIRTVLYQSVDTSLRDQAHEIANNPFRQPRPPREDDPQDGNPFAPPPANSGEQNPNPQFLIPGMPNTDDPNRRDWRHRRPHGEPPPIRFGAIALRPARVLPLEKELGPQPWSVNGFALAQKNHEDIREETESDGERLRVFSLYVPEQGGRGPVVVQTAATLTPTDAVLREIQTALYGLLLPLALVVGVGGAFLTNFALSPVRQLTNAVSKIQENNLSERLPAPGGGDTFDHLVALLNELLARLDAAFARQKRFTGDASHELRTPLAVIKSATSLLLENPESLTPLQERALRRADQSVDRANQLVSDLLLLARTESGLLPVRQTRILVNPLVMEVLAELDATQPAPHAELRTVLPESLEVTTDPAHIRRLLINLLTNALRHTPATGEVTVTVRAVANTWELQVQDTGEGIAPDELTRLGQQFYRPDASRAREHGGTGLGLALCKGIVAALEGTLKIESTVGVGTTITVHLPLLSRGDD